ncbi:MAG: glycoside hydrolase 43 family protein [Bacteroidales bacterium]|nr:glycoside hydrolase 43 family protein [Bacteroidales bacterium]
MGFRTLALAAVILTAAVHLSAQDHPLAWGDQGNGTYINPVLNGDWSDPDAIRVGDRYYMVASDFHFLGMQILESDDLVNWRILTQVYDRFDYPGWDGNAHYAGGSWAPALRYHDGRFWIYFCTPDEGLFMTQAQRPEGPWSPLHLVKAVQRWEDPCPFWDDDGQAYLGRSRHGAGPIIVHRMSADGRELLDDGVTVYTGPVAEGTKWLKRDGWYYLSIPEGGVEGGWQTVLRSKNIYGPYEKRVVLEQGSTDVNGPHQGAIVDTPDGNWWFLHFQRAGALGRVVHLQPMHWSEDGWPVIGVDLDRNGVGEPVRVWTKPFPDSPAFLPQTGDDFASGTLSPQWQWNHNPVEGAWSLTEQPGALTLHALPSGNIWTARNTLTQRVLGYESEAVAELDLRALGEGDRAGLACMGRGSFELGVVRRDGGNWIYLQEGAPDGQEKTLARLRGGRVWLRLYLDIPARSYRYSYSLDGKRFVDAGEPFFVDYGFWKGVRFGLYCYGPSGGSVSIPAVQYDVKR